VQRGARCRIAPVVPGDNAHCGNAASAFPSKLPFLIPRKPDRTTGLIASRPDDRIVISWDIALSEIESGDYSACVVLLIRKEIGYILEVVRGRFPFETLKKKVKTALKPAR
jgi:phage terminase large subunit-like protein